MPAEGAGLAAALVVADVPLALVVGVGVVAVAMPLVGVVAGVLLPLFTGVDGAVPFRLDDGVAFCFSSGGASSLNFCLCKRSASKYRSLTNY